MNARYLRLLVVWATFCLSLGSFQSRNRTPSSIIPSDDEKPRVSENPAPAPDFGGWTNVMVTNDFVRIGALDAFTRLRQENPLEMQRVQQEEMDTRLAYVHSQPGRGARLRLELGIGDAYYEVLLFWANGLNGGVRTLECCTKTTGLDPLDNSLQAMVDRKNMQQETCFDSLPGCNL